MNLDLIVLNQWSTVSTIWLGLLGQTGFIALFSFRQWRKYRITRAFYYKSWAMEGILFRSALLLTVRGFRPNIEDPAWVSISAILLNTYVLWTIWFQFIALIIEIKGGKPLLDHDEAKEAQHDAPNS